MLIGGGGVGKSKTINVVARHCDKALKQIGDDPNQPRIIIMAPTGMAACIIGMYDIYLTIAILIQIKSSPFRWLHCALYPSF